MIPFPQAFFTSAPEDSAEGSRSGPRASARTADEVRGTNEAVVGPSDQAWPIGGTPVRLSHVLAPKPAHAGSDGSPARTFYDIFFDSIRATVEAFDR